MVQRTVGECPRTVTAGAAPRASCPATRRLSVMSVFARSSIRTATFSSLRILVKSGMCSGSANPSASPERARDQLTLRQTPVMHDGTVARLRGTRVSRSAPRWRRVRSSSQAYPLAVKQGSLRRHVGCCTSGHAIVGCCRSRRCVCDESTVAGWRTPNAHAHRRR